MRSRLTTLFVIILFLMAGCQSADQKRDKFFKSGEKYLADKKYEEATIQLKNAIQVDHDYVPAHVALGKVFQATGDVPNAIASFRKAAELDDKNIEARIQLGRYLLGVGSAANPEPLKQTQEIAGQI